MKVKLKAAAVRQFSVILILCLLVQPVCFAAPGSTASAKPEVSAESAILMCPDGRVICEKNADEPRAMASTTKIMTALIAIENLSPDAVVTVPDEAVGVEGSSMYLQKGETLTVRDLLYALMLQSANDAATALAVLAAGSVERFADMMNDRAAEMGLTSTHFVNPHGLDHPDHYTTARELAKITSEALKNETFAAITSTFKYSYTTDLKSGIFVNHNKLLWQMENCVGGKTGFTKKTGRCLVSVTDNDKVIFICVTLSDPDDWNDHKTLHSYGRSLTRIEPGAADGEFTFELPVINGTAPKITCSNVEGEPFAILDGDDIGYEVELPRFLYAPVNAGDVCGRILIRSAGAQVGEMDIVALAGSENVEYKNLLERILDFIKGLFDK